MLSLKNDLFRVKESEVRWQPDTCFVSRAFQGAIFFQWWFKCRGFFRVMIWVVGVLEVNVSLPPHHHPHKCPCGNRVGAATSRHWTAAVSLVANLWKRSHTHTESCQSSFTSLTPHLQKPCRLAEQTQCREKQHSLMEYVYFGRCQC